MRQYKMVTVNCEQCGHPFSTRVSNRRRGWGRFCSHSCTAKGTARPQHGKANPNWKGGVSSNHYHYKKLQKERYPERIRAREIAMTAIISGKLIRQPCTVCEKPNAQAHHEDYSRPLEVIWLCAQHHRELHQRRGTPYQ